MKRFHVTGVCIPEKDYMVDITDKLNQIIKMVNDGEYFTINRSRQYGKTTTLAALSRRLCREYLVIWLSFEGFGEIAFQNDLAFVRNFVRKTTKELERSDLTRDIIESWESFDDYSEEKQDDALDYLSGKITTLCNDCKKEILLMIDEVDKSTDNQIFLNFLGMLRNKYLDTRSGRDQTFKSVILAGVYDIKNLKLKLRPDAEKKYNSPWNVAADFKVDMSFSPEEISTMLKEYEEDHQTGMDIDEISRELYFYTNGHPYLISRLCKWVDEEGGKLWTKDNIRDAEKAILKTRNTLFDDLIKNIENNEELKKLVTYILYNGGSQSFSPANPVIEAGVMLGILGEKDHMVVISNVIFETYLYDYVISIKTMETNFTGPLRSQFIEHGKLNVPLLLQKFQELMKSEYRQEDETFIEQQGRLLFLCFLKPVINGTGFYYVESETRNHTRMDIVIVYGGEEHIIELKIWHGRKYRREGIRQLTEYLESRNAKKGYLISFSFNKRKEYRCGWLPKNQEKDIFEVIV